MQILNTLSLICIKFRSLLIYRINVDFIQSPVLLKCVTSLMGMLIKINHLKPELNPICYLLALLGAHHFLHVSRIRVKLLNLRRLMSYIYGTPVLDVPRSHTTTQHSR